MDEEYTAYCRKLLRALKNVKEALDQKEIEKAKKIIDNLIEDTEKDIEA